MFLPAQALQDTGQAVWSHCGPTSRPVPPPLSASWALPHSAHPAELQPFPRSRSQPGGSLGQAAASGSPGQVTATVTAPGAGCLWQNPARSIFLVCCNLLRASRSEG